MRSSPNSPLPGDLVIRQALDRSLVRPIVVFVITLWPTADVMAGPYQSYGYALEKARQIALQRQLYVWRDYSSDPEKPQLENVSENE